MTNRQMDLVEAEIRRHAALSLLSDKPAAKEHMDVAVALAAALCASRQEDYVCKIFTSAIRTVLRRLRSLGKKMRNAMGPGSRAS